MTKDYKSTVFLPKTDFPMKAELPKREPAMLARWKQQDLNGQIRRGSKGRPKFVLHDGPPYANGNLHIGHALNKILKDVVSRSQQMLGKDSVYVPGWDCHGLPIEWKIEERYRAAGKDKDAVPILEFRRECREFAQHWIGVQSEEFQRLGVMGDWANPYTTMSYGAEAQIAREIAKFALNGSLYRGARPVLWSVVEKTALADAEVEYHDHVSTTIFVRFPIVETKVDALKGASAVIWTTTPWTIPGNRAIAYGEAFDYGVYRAEEVAPESLAKAGEAFLVAAGLREAFEKAAGILRSTEIWSGTGAALAGAVARHPWRGKGYEFPVPLLPAAHVTLEAGTGLVHTAPGHGAEDFEVGIAHGLEVPDTVDEDGVFVPSLPMLAGRRVLTSEGKTGDADKAVVAALKDAGALVAHGRLTHSYPHSWRSKAPLIFRNTAQWFISMETNGLRAKALKAIEGTRFVPAAGRNRLHSMVETRPDWCISRQRAWGVPIAVFVDRRTGKLLRDQAVFDRIAEAFEKEGGDCWFSSEPARFLGSDHDSANFEQVRDIVEVWFEAGSTHSFVLEKRADLKWPASLYLEGSDQHRGWFQASLLEACGTRGRAPFEAVLTHGFVLDEQGRKMSKSLGNVVAPQEVTEKNGAEILRLWVAGSDYSDDLRIGPEILKHQIDLYRRLRNTLRYLLGNLAGFSEEERLPHAEMPELERWVLHRLAELDGVVRRAVEDFDFNALFTALHTFCAVDLSAFYFDVRKDSLYCDRPDAVARRAARAILDELFSCLTAWLAPVMCFTAEEAWLARHGEQAESVHLRQFPELPASWRDDALAAKWRKIRALRRVVTGALELERENKRIGASLQAAPTVYATEDYVEAMRGLDLAEIAITSSATLVAGAAPEGAFTLEDVAGVGVVSALADGSKCQRCWRVLPDVGSVAGHEDICGRCADAVGPSQAAAE
ncbi:MAG: isoleucine--tRNA ligase [Alphaproteobacteria bacterium]